MHCRNIHHFQLALRYLKGTIGQGLSLKRNRNLNKEIYTNASFVGSLVDRRLTISICTFLGGSLIAWISKKNSSIKVKY